MKVFYFTFTLISVATFSMVAQAQNTLTFEEFLKRVETTHPESLIDAKILRIDEERKSAAGRLSDPQISLGRERVPIDSLSKKQDIGMPERADERAWTLNVTQMLPWLGTLDSQRNAASLSAKRNALGVEASALARRFEAAEFFLHMVDLSKRIEVEKENLAEVKQVSKYAAARLGHALGSHHELLLAENESFVTSSNLNSLSAELENLKETARALMGAASTSSQFQLSFPKIEQVVERKDTPVSDLSAAQITARKEERSAQIETESSQTKPEFMTSAMLMREDTGMVMYGAMVGIRVPLFSGGVRRALDSEKLLASERSTAELNWHETKKKVALAQIERRLEAINKTLSILQKNLLPATREHVQSTLIEFSNGRGSFRTVSEARQSLINFRKSEITFLHEQFVSLLNKERILAGFVEGDFNSPLPMLSTSQMGSADMGMGAMSGRGAPMKNMNTPKKSRSQTLDEDEPRNKGMGGMGM